MSQKKNQKSMGWPLLNLFSTASLTDEQRYYAKQPSWAATVLCLHFGKRVKNYIGYV